MGAARNILLLGMIGGGFWAYQTGRLDGVLSDLGLVELSGGKSTGQGASGGFGEAEPKAELEPVSEVVSEPGQLGQTKTERLLFEHRHLLHGWTEANRVWFAAMVHVESGGDPGAVSPDGALGVAQVMPATATSLHDNYGYTRFPATRAALLTVEGSLYFGSALLDYLENKFPGKSREWMTRAYNGGESWEFKGSAVKAETKQYYDWVLARFNKIAGKEA